MPVATITLKAADGYAMVIPSRPTYHTVQVPNGYAVAMVDEVVKGFEPVKLDYPAGEDRDVEELGDAKKLTVLW